MGNVTISIPKKRVQGQRRSVVLDVTLSSSYATNGDSLVAADQQAIFAALNIQALSQIEVADCEMGNDGTSLYFDRTNAKFKAFSGRSEVANATNLSATPGAIRVELFAAAVTG